MRVFPVAVCWIALGIGMCAELRLVFAEDKSHDHHAVKFTVRSTKNGRWSDPQTWSPPRVPQQGDRVLISRKTRVEYDVQSKAVIRLVQIVGELEFSRQRDTELNVGLLKVQNSDTCSESGFACDFLHATKTGEPSAAPSGALPALIVGARDRPIPREHTARIRLHFLQGMSEKDAPAIACCSARMEIHGSPLAQSWCKLGADCEAGSVRVQLTGDVSDWRVGDQVLITASGRASGGGTFRAGRGRRPQTEERVIVDINGNTLKLDRPLEFAHRGAGEFRSEVANVTRNVVVESADPNGVRGHTVYHRFSRGGISYARFAHLGKEGVLGRYAIHFHLVGSTMRGSAVEGVAIVDSHNRWLTIHGTQYLIVRDCIGYQSVGHGFFLEDGSEVYNLLDHNLAVQAYRGRRLPEQVLPFDPNDGAGFWWANGRNTLTRNVAAENDEYGYRYDMQNRSNFDSRLLVLHPDGKERVVDVRTIPIWRFEDNEAHSEGLYGMVVAANGNSQPDSPIHNERMLERIKSIDWTGPDTQHPHVIRNFAIWNSHYAFRPHSPAMRIENLRIHRAAYGVYRPAFENHEYVNLHISDVAAEPFNRGMDDASAQIGRISVDGLRFRSGYGNRSTPLVQISDVNLSGKAETHFRHVSVERPEQFRDRWPLINRGVGPRVKPITDGVPIFIHDHFGPGRHAKVVSSAARDLLQDGGEYRTAPPLTGEEARVAEVTGVPWPKLLDPIDDLPPATVITEVASAGEQQVVKGISHDNGEIVSVLVNGRPAQILSSRAGVVDWAARVPLGEKGVVTARAIDAAGNEEQTPHQLKP